MQEIGRQYEERHVLGKGKGGSMAGTKVDLCFHINIYIYAHIRTCTYIQIYKYTHMIHTNTHTHTTHTETHEGELDVQSAMGKLLKLPVHKALSY
jgi:hypothetical protein